MSAYWLHFEDNPDAWLFCRGYGTWNAARYRVWFIGPLQIWWRS